MFSMYLAASAAKYCRKGSRYCGKSSGKRLGRVWKVLGSSILISKYWKCRKCRFLAPEGAKNKHFIGLGMVWDFEILEMQVFGA